MRLSVSTFEPSRDEPRSVLAMTTWAGHDDQGLTAFGGGSALGRTAEQAIGIAAAEAVERRAAYLFYKVNPRGTHVGGVALHKGEATTGTVQISMESSTGWAVGSTQLAADAKALLEVVERVALARLLSGEVLGEAMPLEGLQMRAARYRLRVEGLVLTDASQLAQVVAVALFDETGAGPAASLGVGCSTSAMLAAEDAAREALKVRLWMYNLSGVHGRLDIDESWADAAKRAAHFATETGARELAQFLADRRNGVRKGGKRSELEATLGKEPELEATPLTKVVESAGIDVWRVDLEPWRLLSALPVAHYRTTAPTYPAPEYGLVATSKGSIQCPFI